LGILKEEVKNRNIKNLKTVMYKDESSILIIYRKFFKINSEYNIMYRKN